ncbi:hypothetical protein ACFQX7_06200 [Luedemannella flava]
MEGRGAAQGRVAGAEALAGDRGATLGEHPGELADDAVHHAGHARPHHRDDVRPGELRHAPGEQHVPEAVRTVGAQHHVDLLVEVERSLRWPGLQQRGVHPAPGVRVEHRERAVRHQALGEGPGGLQMAEVRRVGQVRLDRHAVRGGVEPAGVDEVLLGAGAPGPGAPLVELARVVVRGHRQGGQVVAGRQAVLPGVDAQVGQGAWREREQAHDRPAGGALVVEAGPDGGRSVHAA